MDRKLYALEKLNSAVRMLAVGAGDARARVTEASSAFATLSPEDFPPGLDDRFQDILTRITKKDPQVAPNGKLVAGAIDMTMRSVWRKTAAKIAEDIWLLRDALEREIARSEDEVEPSN